MRSEKEISITHTITVDSCIADEIEKLNNINKIYTEYSCCGHGDSGFIIVRSEDADKMCELGYEPIGGQHKIVYGATDTTAAYVRIQCNFKPKSVCGCIE